MIPFRDDVPSRRYPVVTILIILLNVAVFLYELFLPQRALAQFIGAYGLVPARLEAANPVQGAGQTVISIFTSMFLHGGWLHLIGNMWYLWIFGDNVEDRMGHFRFLLFYLLCGFLGSAAHLYFNWGSQTPSIGASGAIAGVLGAYFMSYPFARIVTLVPLLLFWPIIELPAFIVLGSWFLFQLVSGSAAIAAASQTMGGVAWWAHIGGFLAGMLLIWFFARKPVRRRYSWDFPGNQH